jgi:peptidoglycan hydrolase FlgJ
MDVTALQHPVSAADVQPERLANNPALTDQQKVAEASRQFEAILVRQILQDSQKTVIKSKFSDDSTSSSIYRDMVTTQLADSISHSGAFGFAKTFEQQLTHPTAANAKNGAQSASTASLPASAEPAPNHRSQSLTAEKRSALPANHQPVPLHERTTP